MLVHPIIKKKKKKQISSATQKERLNYLSNLSVENVTKLMSYKEQSEQAAKKTCRGKFIRAVWAVNLQHKSVIFLTGSCLQYG
jgi:ABC-type Mn2+/Zn2+ transport system ATPase subunit